MRIDGARAYGGMRLRHNPCNVFIDNPLFSELISTNHINPTASKLWARYVKQTGQRNNCFVPAEPGTEDDYLRLESQWQSVIKRSVKFDQLWSGWRDVKEDPSLPWLIACPRTEILEYWYGRTLVSWLAEVTAHLTARGDSYVVRSKQDRKHRMHDKQARIIWTAQQYRGVITAHSVSSIDAILAGRPAVIWGQDPSMGCATPWTDFLSAGIVYEPDVDEVKEAAWTWAKTTYSTLNAPEAVKCVMK